MRKAKAVFLWLFLLHLCSGEQSDVIRSAVDTMVLNGNFCALAKLFDQMIESNETISSTAFQYMDEQLLDWMSMTFDQCLPHPCPLSDEDVHHLDEEMLPLDFNDHSFVVIDRVIISKRNFEKYGGKDHPNYVTVQRVVKRNETKHRDRKLNESESKSMVENSKGTSEAKKESSEHGTQIISSSTILYLQLGFVLTIILLCIFVGHFKACVNRKKTRKARQYVMAL